MLAACNSVHERDASHKSGDSVALLNTNHALWLFGIKDTTLHLLPFLLDSVTSHTTEEKERERERERERCVCRKQSPGWKAGHKAEEKQEETSSEENMLEAEAQMNGGQIAEEAPKSGGNCGTVGQEGAPVDDNSVTPPAHNISTTSASSG